MKLACALGLVASCVLLALSSVAMAQDPESGLIGAEERAASAEAEVAELKSAVRLARSGVETAARRAAPIQSRARHGAAHVAAIEASLREHRLRAVADVKHIEEERSGASEKHGKAIRSGVGFGIAALVIAAVAFAWDWFRASAAVAFLTRMELGQAIGLCVGSGLLAVIIGGAISSIDGVLGAIGYAVFSLGFMLPIAFVLARHSAEVQRGRAKPRLRRERLSSRVTQGLAGLFAALFLIAFGSAVFAGEAKSGAVTSGLREEAREIEPSSPSLATAEDAAAKLKRKAAPLIVLVHHKQADLRTTKRKLAQAQAHFAADESDVHLFTRRVAAIEARELREREREEREEQRQSEDEQRELEKAEKENAELTACDPNYEGECLKDGIGDYDCAGGDGNGPNYVYSPVTVVGVDVFGLDANGNGIGCEDE